MSAHMKGLRTSKQAHIELTVGMPGSVETHYKIPNTEEVKIKLKYFIQSLTDYKEHVTPWEEATPWETLAADRIKKHTRAGLALRGARYREGLSQKELAKQCGISQDNLSRMENGKRVIGEKVAKKLAKALNIDYRLLIET